MYFKQFSGHLADPLLVADIHLGVTKVKNIKSLEDLVVRTDLSKSDVSFYV